MTSTMVESCATPAPGTPACASMIAAETGISFSSPSTSAARAVSRPARWPGAKSVPGIFAVTTSASFGCTAAKYSDEGYPFLLFHIALYPAWQVDRGTSDSLQCGNGPEMSCQTNQSPPSIQ